MSRHATGRRRVASADWDRCAASAASHWMSRTPAMNDDLAARDAANRTAALDVTRSFLVQAPAGSGKTELLIQRYLALLAYVDRPERVVAMTFTRKAAGEMRERIVTALAQAKAGLPPAKPHERLTFDLATKALAQDARHEW